MHHVCGHSSFGADDSVSKVPTLSRARMALEGAHARTERLEPSSRLISIVWWIWASGTRIGVCVWRLWLQSGCVAVPVVRPGGGGAVRRVPPVCVGVRCALLDVP